MTRTKIDVFHLEQTKVCLSLILMGHAEVNLKSLFSQRAANNFRLN